MKHYRGIYSALKPKVPTKAKRKSKKEVKK
jgi:hypothetical protein